MKTYTNKFHNKHTYLNIENSEISTIDDFNTLLDVSFYKVEENEIAYLATSESNPKIRGVFLSALVHFLFDKYYFI